MSAGRRRRREASLGLRRSDGDCFSSRLPRTGNRGIASLLSQVRKGWRNPRQAGVMNGEEEGS